MSSDSENISIENGLENSDCPVGNRIHCNRGADITVPSNSSSCSTSTLVTIKNIHTFDRLPEELVLYILLHCEDTDLQSMARVSKHMRKLASDMILWKKFRLVKNSHLLTSKLFRKTRPDRTLLVQSHIMRGVNVRQIESGQYVNGPSAQLMHQNQSRVEWLLRESVIRDRLSHRPQTTDLTSKNVMPNGIIMNTSGEAGTSISPLIASKAVDLKHALKQAVLSRQLRRRSHPQDINPNVMRGASTSSRVAPSLLAAKLGLERHFQERDLQQKIDRRPSVDMIGSRLHVSPLEVAQLVCPSVKPKIKTFEAFIHDDDDVETDEFDENPDVD